MKTIFAATVLLIIAVLFSPSMNILGNELSEPAQSGLVVASNAEKPQRFAQVSTRAETTVFDPTAETPDIESAVPIDLDKLFNYLKEGAYKSFAAQESSPHPTRGPHTDLGWPVRVFMDPIVDASLAAGNESHPVGSSIVKEMYDDNGELQGWAVMVKTQNDSAGGKGWFWYETTNTMDASDRVAAGNGVQLCQGCHFIGKDFVLTTYPLQ